MQRCKKGCGRWVTHSVGGICLTCERANRPNPCSIKTSCPRCAGVGRVHQHRHINGDRCGLCRGAGVVEGRKAAEERLQQIAAEERTRYKAEKQALPFPEPSEARPEIHACAHCGECFPSWREKYEHRCGMAPPPMERVAKASYEDVTSGGGEPGYWYVRAERPASMPKPPKLDKTPVIEAAQGDELI